jgi:choline dehydrogenase-like flavoprotein
LFIDARNLPENKIIKTDVCIIGAGAAGITLALEFIDQPFQVCLIESGGLQFDKKTQSLSEGENIGVPYWPLHESRLRYFGGSTNHWGGWCWPLDEIDFETRDWVPHSGWPFRKSHIEPFYERARIICKLGPFDYDVENWETEKVPRLGLILDRVITKIIQIRPISFGQMYRDNIARAKNISVYLHANVLEIETNDAAKNVTRLHIACLEGKKFWAYAKVFILATGGIENARLLLLSRKVQTAGLGNQNDLVGRFFMEHPHLFSGIFMPSDPLFPTELYTGFGKVNNTIFLGALTLSEDTQRRENLTNFGATLGRSNQYPDWFQSLRILRSEISQGELPDDFLRHLKNVITEIDQVWITAYKRLLQGERYPLKYYYIYNRTEQVPNPDSRVTLSSQRDGLGQNRVRLDWRLSKIDKSSIRRANEIIGIELGRAGLGRLRISLDEDDTSWPPSLTGGRHHMGTTRMHIDPKKGVVNENCQVHGISNLFVAGSSVFPTSGQANPTLTIVALTLRLADHIKAIMK